MDETLCYDQHQLAVAVRSPHHARNIFRGGAVQQHTATEAASVARACLATVGEMSAPSLEAQPTTGAKSISSGS
jgi:hypothetical protein